MQIIIKDKKVNRTFAWEELMHVLGNLNTDVTFEVHVETLNADGDLIGFINVGGGEEGRVLVGCYDYASNQMCILIDRNQSRPVKVHTGGGTFATVSAERAVDLTLAIKAMRYYYDHQTVTSELEWECNNA